MTEWPGNGAARSDDASSILQRAARGDEEAWRELVVAYQHRVFGLVARQCGDRDLAEEITQQTFVKVVRQFAASDDAGYEEQGKFESWLFRIAMNCLRDEMRRRKRQARPMQMTDSAGDDDPASSEWLMAQERIVSADDSNHSPLDRMEASEQIAALRSAIARLPEADREVLHLRHTAGLSFPQIAESLEQPLGTVLARAHRAVGKLKKILAGEDETHASQSKAV